VPERVAGGGARQGQHPCRAKQGKAMPAVALAAAVQGREPDLQAGADAGGHGKVTATSQGHRHKWSTHNEGRRIRREEASGAREMQKTGGCREGRTRARSLVSCTRGDEPEGEAAKRRRRPDATSWKEPQCSQAWRAPFVHAEVGAGATQRGFYAQRRTGGSGRPAMIAPQQVERTMELQNLEV
jgi:hypothetical protein